jgi:hypothetical protein
MTSGRPSEPRGEASVRPGLWDLDRRLRRQRLPLAGGFGQLRPVRGCRQNPFSNSRIASLNGGSAAEQSSLD